MSDGTREVQTHPVVVGITHWVMALAILMLIGSGSRIYKSAPIFGFTFPEQFALGGDWQDTLVLDNEPGVANALLWHFTAMWLLLVSYLGFMLWNLASSHFWRDFLPIGPKTLRRDFTAALTFRLQHKLGDYNVVQRVACWVALGSVAMMLLSGIAIWKPVQTDPLEAPFGGFQGARLVHFLFMTIITGFIAVHVALVILVPKPSSRWCWGKPQPGRTV